MNQTKVKEFYKKCIQEGMSKPISLNNVPDEGLINKQPKSFATFTAARSNKPYGDSSARLNESTSKLSRRIACSVCNKPSTKRSPAFTSGRCDHAVCIECFTRCNPVFDRVCFMKDCGQRIKYDDFQDFLQKAAGISNFDVYCSKCSAETNSSKVYVNPGCEHVLCGKCTSKLTNRWCPISTCREQLNEDKLLTFSHNLIKEEDNQSLLKKTINCPFCQHQIEIYAKDTSKSEYLRCPSCEGVFCPEHNQLMSKCLCLCPRCLGRLNNETSINAKYCDKCYISYCMRCKKETKGRQGCPCMDEEHKNDDGLQGFLQKAAEISNFDAYCSKCSAETKSSKVYMNPGCEHVLCGKCTSKLTDRWCPMSTCREQLDEDKLFAFSLNLIKEEDHHKKLNDDKIQDFAYTPILDAISAPNVNLRVILNSIVDKNEELAKVHTQIKLQAQLEEKKVQEQRNRLQVALSSEMECTICLDYIHQCVTVVPCLHNFCAACFSDYMQKYKVCPTCQEVLHSVKKNAILNNIIEKFLDENPEKKRSNEEYKNMEGRDRIKRETIKF